MPFSDQDWYMTTRTPGGVAVFRIAPGAVRALASKAPADVDRDLAEADAVESLMAGVRRSLGFPVAWSDDPAWDVCLAPGVPHASVVAAAVNVTDGRIPDA